jgi:hypothetical protein
MTDHEPVVCGYAGGQAISETAMAKAAGPLRYQRVFKVI